jgi:hypothetical protein
MISKAFGLLALWKADLCDAVECFGCRDANNTEADGTQAHRHDGVVL